MEERLQCTLLYDFYGELLTDKQKLVYEMYYQNDLSLTEIGEELNISRQAVRDQLTRTKNILLGYESKLMLMCKFQEQRKAVLNIKEILEAVEHTNITLPPEIIESIEKVKQISTEMLK